MKIQDPKIIRINTMKKPLKKQKMENKTSLQTLQKISKNIINKINNNK